MVNTCVKGPSPTAVEAAMIQVYVVNGFSPLMTILVLVLVYWTTSPVVSNVTLIK